MKTNFSPVVFLASSRSTLPPAHIHEADEATADAFRWLLALGFPAEVAAARVRPELFAEPVAQIDTAAPFPRPIETHRAA